jgi:membrane protease subunit HflK
MAWNEPGPGRDPWNTPPGGGKRGGGAPDIDALLKRLRAWLSSGGKRGPSGLVGLLLPLLILAWLISGCYTVEEQERGIVLRFGAYAGTDEPGFRWHFPWPVESVVKINVAGVRSVSNHSTLLTQDLSIVDVALTVQYRVSSAVDYLFNVQDPDNTLQQATASALREVVGASTMNEVLNNDGRALAERTRHVLQDRLDAYKAGLLLTDVTLQEAQPPDAVKAAFDDVDRAREEARRVRADAEAYANDRLPRARSDAERRMAEASAYRDQVIARAEGDASRFSELLAEYRRAPQVTRDRLYLDAMSDVLNQSSKILVDVEHGSPVINVPLEQLLKAAPESSAAAESQVRPGMTGLPNAQRSPPSPGAGTGSDEGLRSRERGSH